MCGKLLYWTLAIGVLYCRSYALYIFKSSKVVFIFMIALLRLFRNWFYKLKNQLAVVHLCVSHLKSPVRLVVRPSDSTNHGSRAAGTLYCVIHMAPRGRLVVICTSAQSLRCGGFSSRASQVEVASHNLNLGTGSRLLSALNCCAGFTYSTSWMRKYSLISLDSCNLSTTVTFSFRR
jgi:hypothetical protein